MLIRTIAAALNGSFVLVLYLAAWGAPSAIIAGLELTFALGAAIATWYALDLRRRSRPVALAETSRTA
jgi:hypothetical protein